MNRDVKINIYTHWTVFHALSNIYLFKNIEIFPASSACSLMASWGRTFTLLLVIVVHHPNTKMCFDKASETPALSQEGQDVYCDQFANHIVVAKYQEAATFCDKVIILKQAVVSWMRSAQNFCDNKSMIVVQKWYTMLWCEPWSKSNQKKTITQNSRRDKRSDFEAIDQNWSEGMKQQ